MRKAQGLVEKPIHLTHTRPEQFYIVSVISQFMHDHRESHLQAASKILQYLTMQDL